MWPYYPDLLAKAVPRYTSYPTAVEFSDAVGPDDYLRALQNIKSSTPASLYVHIPYCDRICWYCGCNTGAANRTQRLANYLTALNAELKMVAQIMGGRAPVRRISFGGGSPNAISPIQFVRLLDRIVTLFDAGSPEISIEIDPRSFTNEWALVLAASNVSRVSLGVQTFAPHVQAAIGRVQPLSTIEECMASLRLRGIEAINFDLMYGLPGQSLEDLDETLTETIRLRPSRIALFGYAHLPSAIPRQRRIDDSNLPDAELRFAQNALGYGRLTQAGYLPVGFDHFALPDDPLAKAASEGRVHRNFQGFTEDDNPLLIGFGASAISSLPGLIVQNEKNSGAYRSLVTDQKLPVVKGVRLDQPDLQRAHYIERLLCDGHVDVDSGFADNVRPMLQPFEDRGLVTWRGKELTICDAGRPYSRLIAAKFDRFRQEKSVNFSQPV